MNSIHLQQTLPQVFADRNSIVSDIWHQDLFFRKGKMYLIEAASGTGKSSLCSYIYGYRNDYQGIINFDETNIKAYSVKQWVDLRKHSLSMLFQDLRIFTELTALENVQLKNNLTGYKKKKEVLAYFEQLGIADKINVKAGKLSFGQQQRVAFIRALCQPSMSRSAIWTMRTAVSWEKLSQPKLKGKEPESSQLPLASILIYLTTTSSNYDQLSHKKILSHSFKPLIVICKIVNKMSALVWKLLRQHISIGQLAGFFLANLFGMMIVLLSMQFYKDVIPVFTEGDSFMKKDFIIATKKISTLGSFAGKSNTLTADNRSFHSFTIQSISRIRDAGSRNPPFHRYVFRISP